MTNTSTIQLKDILINGGDIKKAASIIRSINHKLRQIMLVEIDKAGSITVTDLFVVLRLEQSVCSQHLAILRKNDIVKTERNGKHILYSINYTRLQYIVELIGKLSQ